MTQETMNQKQICWDFPGGPVVKISPFSAEDVGLIPGQPTRPHMPLGQKPKHKTEAILQQIQ